MAKKHWVERLIVENFCRLSEISIVCETVKL